MYEQMETERRPNPHRYFQSVRMLSTFGNVRFGEAAFRRRELL
jgi:hypothetical protein